MSEKRFEFYSDDYLIGVLDNVTGKTLNHFATIDLLNEQQDKITELEIELTDCKNRKEQYEYKNTKLIAKIDFLERVIEGDV